MYYHSLNFNRYKITKAAFVVFMVIGILNWTLAPKLITYADDEASVATEAPAPVEAPAPAPTEAPVESPATTEAAPSDTEVTTGDAVASSDVVNEVNTNEVNSEGEVIVVSGSLGDSSLDLRGDTASTTTASTTCDSCIGTTTIENQNTATVTNEIIVAADTGLNTASSTATSTIQTGDALAGANLVNIVNTNIVDSQYMLLVFNNFGDWSGDLVFPNIDFFANFLSLLNPNCNCGGNTNISNSNTTNVENGVNTSAQTGDNNASGGSIDTGNALASSNTWNLINTNVYGNSSFYLLVKVFGDWNGNIFNLPAGMVWQNTPEGLVIYNEANSPFATQSSGSSDLNINNTNSADILNNVNVSANTGGNNATGTSSFIKTGNAYAGSNVVNIINTNIISSNWMMALINILGNWHGNISFGQPDLWVGTVASVDGSAEAGSSVTFTTTVKNNGDARASDINVLAALRSSNFRFAQSYSGSNLHHIDALLPGESIQFSYMGQTEKFVPDNRPPVIIDTTISSFETDANMGDNTDTISFNIAFNPGVITLPQNSLSTSYPGLSVTKTHTIPSTVVEDGVEMIPAGGRVDYKIVVKNNGGSAYEGLLFDELKDENGEIINEQQWDLGEILPNEEITVTYTTEFSASTTPGTYTNYAWVEATNSPDSNTASDLVVVAGIPTAPIVEEIVGEVLGALTQNISSLDVAEDVTFEHDLPVGGFCSEKAGNDFGKLGFSQTMLLGLSFALVMHRAKNVNNKMVLL